MHDATVSVLITVYNDESNIGRAIDSVLGQTFSDFELIIVNDGSTDQTTAILDCYAEKDKRIRVIHQANQGTANAANTGLACCNGKYMARLDSDDVSYPFRLQVEVEFLEAHPDINLVGGQCHIADDNGHIIGTRRIMPSDPYKTILNRCIYQQSDIMLRRSVLEKIPGRPVYRGKFKGAEDYDLWLRISEVGGIAKIDKAMGIWRLNKGGYTLSRKQEQLDAVKVLRRMAVARRNGSRDWYASYTPVRKAKIHRAAINKVDYDVTVSQVLLKEGKTAEIKMRLKPYKQSNRDWAIARKWYYLSLLPKPILRILFGIREMILNNSSIELR